MIKLVLKKVYNKLPVLLFDILSIPLAWYLAYWLRYNMQSFPTEIISLNSLEALTILILVQTSCYYGCKVYRGLWRFSSLDDVMRILRAVMSAIFLVTPIFYFAAILSYIPRSILPLYGLILVTILCGGRLLLRHYWHKKFKNDDLNDNKRVIIIGAGQAGEGLVRDLKRLSSYTPVGIIDDDPKKHGLEVHGVRVVGSLDRMESFVKHYQVDLIFIAVPSACSADMRRIVAYCESCKIPFQTLPGIRALASGQVTLNALRQVKISDLLGRDQVHLDWHKIDADIKGKRILVTGGGGSIGSELCRQIIKLSPDKILIVDHHEFNLYKIEQELKNNFPNISIHIALVSVIDKTAINNLFSQFKPEIVFHAAAFKHVPLLENQVRVAVQNNIIGTKVVAEASVEYAVGKFILISTDKAVNPTNVMGATKRAAEIYCQNFNAWVDTQFITVRFGNVLGSVGSVVPLFQAQLEQGGPLTVTHPDIERYFMTIPEASQLILQAMVSGRGGEIFVLDMGEPVKIRYLAEQMIRLAGKDPGTDIEIQYTGLRPGEKLFEELFYGSEKLIQTEHDKILQAQFLEKDWNELEKVIMHLKKAIDGNQDDDILLLLKQLVPEFCNQNDSVVSIEERIEER